ncbi:thioesterase family protein [uncultured Polaribacter sp.]|uniref:acyl-CoA thioesterase n=1 Tax=uncultured Polaribacter sp. TaxID=174711 RepID=UPI0030D6E45F|tara:strand:+ start:616 stop:1011 length:396 start_codon:yes stop_codon:yes gene_type:complete
MENVFEVKFTVSSADIDDLNHVNNVVYVKWMDEVAFQHWAYLTKDYPLPEYIWVVTRHEIDYKGQAFLGDEIIAKTWVGETKGFTSARIIEFYKDTILVAKSKTVWAMLDAETYKLTRIRENVLKVLQQNK